MHDFNFFKQQPDEILIEIFKNLSRLDQIKIARVDKRSSLPILLIQIHLLILQTDGWK